MKREVLEREALTTGEKPSPSFDLHLAQIKPSSLALHHKKVWLTQIASILMIIENPWKSTQKIIPSFPRVKKRDNCSLDVPVQQLKLSEDANLRLDLGATVSGNQLCITDFWIVRKAQTTGSWNWWKARKKRLHGECWIFRPRVRYALSVSFLLMFSSCTVSLLVVLLPLFSLLLQVL